MNNEKISISQLRNKILEIAEMLSFLEAGEFEVQTKHGIIFMAIQKHCPHTHQSEQSNVDFLKKSKPLKPIDITPEQFTSLYGEGALLDFTKRHKLHVFRNKFIPKQ